MVFSFSIRTLCETFRPNGPKFPKPLIWVFLGGVDLFSARNCYIANLLFDYAHSVKISAQTDPNSESPLLRRFWATLGGVDLFS